MRRVIIHAFMARHSVFARKKSRQAKGDYFSLTCRTVLELAERKGVGGRHCHLSHMFVKVEGGVERFRH
jgi:hypothetical protein